MTGTTEKKREEGNVCVVFFSNRKYVATNKQVNVKLERIWKEKQWPNCKVLSQHSNGSTEEKYEKTLE
jgi:hypothetical protein